MSYEVVVMRFRHHEKTSFEAAPLRTVLSEFGIAEYGSPIYATLPNGLSIDCHTTGLSSDVADDISITFRGVSASLFELLFAICHRCQLTAIVVDHPLTILVASDSDLREIPGDLGEGQLSTVCRSSQDIADAIIPGFAHWNDWRLGRASNSADGSS